jgi:hypothetical protein
MLPGCIIRYPFEFSGAVTSAKDNSPVVGTKIFLFDEVGHEYMEKDPNYLKDRINDCTTAKDGSFLFIKRLSVITSRPDTYYLVFFKEGYRPKSVKLGLQGVRGETVPVRVVVHLRKK